MDLAQLFLRMLRGRGRRSRGSSRNRPSDCPGTVLLRITPATRKILNKIMAYRPSQRKPMGTSIMAMTPVWAEQGTARPSKKARIILSRRVESIRVEITAIVTQPKPRIKGITALPLRPSGLKVLSSSTASRGK